MDEARDTVAEALDVFASITEPSRPEWERARRALRDDLRFEHLTDAQAEAAMSRLASEARLGPHDAVARFLAEHARTPERRRCFFPVVRLRCTETMPLGDGAVLMPLGEIDVLRQIIGQAEDPRCAVIVVDCVGSDLGRMVARGRRRAEQRLRLLRAGVGGDRGQLLDGALRFHLGPDTWIGNGGALRSRLGHARSVLQVEPDTAVRFRAQPLANLAQPAPGIGEHLDGALRWLEKAQLETEPVPQMLCLFFALETILGVSFEGEGAADVIAHRTALARLARSVSPAPLDAYRLYPMVRANAAGGGAPVSIGAESEALAADVHRALNELVLVAGRDGLTTPSEVRDALEKNARGSGRHGTRRGPHSDQPDPLAVIASPSGGG